MIHIIDPSRSEVVHQMAKAVASDHLLMISQGVRLEGIEVESKVITGRPDEEFPKLGNQYPGAILLLSG